jgi:DNA-binding response OmpR family regulator
MSETCLIAAHDPWVIQLLRVFTEESGFQVLQAFDGEEVITLTHQRQPRVILLEAELPGSPRGRDLLDTLQAGADTQHIPVLIFSWQHPNLLKPQSINSHVYLREPITYDDFVTALAKVGVCCPRDVHPMP